MRIGRGRNRPAVCAHLFLWVLAAVCPTRGHTESLLSPGLNTSAVNLFLKQFSRTQEADEYAVLIWDCAGFDTSGVLKLPTNVSVAPLPACSPELNESVALPEEPLLVEPDVSRLRGHGDGGN